MTPIDMTACRAFCERREEARKITGTWLPINRPMPVLQHDARDTDTRPPALSRGPCHRCGTRGDLGCAHQQPFEAHGLAEFTRSATRWDYRRVERAREA